MDPFMMIIPLAVMVTGVVIIRGFFKTFRYFIDRRMARGDDGDLRSEIAELHARIDSLEIRGDRIEELEERLDFAERLLTKGKESDAMSRES